MYLNDVKKMFKENLTILCTFEQDGTRCHSTLSWKTVLMLLLLLRENVLIIMGVWWEKPVN